MRFPVLSLFRSFLSHLTFSRVILRFRPMEVQFSPATEAQLQHLATSQGKNAAQVVAETMTRVLEQQAEFLAGIERGIDDSERGNTVSHDEVVARIHRIFNKS